MRVKKEILKVLPKAAKIAMIYTAANYKGFNKNKDKDSPILKKNGYRIYYYDIEGKKAKEIEKFLKDKAVIYVRGGNSYYLLNQARKSGFNKIVKRLVKAGKIYIGVSAGSYLACPSIEMANWKHQDWNIVKLKNLKALGLVPFLLSVHYKPESKEAIRQGMKKAKFPTRILTDDQAILVKDGKIKFVGKGKEIKIR